MRLGRATPSTCMRLLEVESSVNPMHLHSKSELGVDLMHLHLQVRAHHPEVRLQDYGYGSVENFKGKGGAFQKAKKEAATDAMKRAL